MIQENGLHRSPPLSQPRLPFFFNPMWLESLAARDDAPELVEAFPHAELQSGEKRRPERGCLALSCGYNRHPQHIGLPLQEPGVAGHAAIDAQLGQRHTGVVAGGLDQIGDLERDSL
jgi:hypothetical protein